jgi:hypothetical protein
MMQRTNVLFMSLYGGVGDHDARYTLSYGTRTRLLAKPSRHGLMTAVQACVVIAQEQERDPRLRVIYPEDRVGWKHPGKEAVTAERQRVAIVEHEKRARLAATGLYTKEWLGGMKM